MLLEGLALRRTWLFLCMAGLVLACAARYSLGDSKTEKSIEVSGQTFVFHGDDIDSISKSISVTLLSSNGKRVGALQGHEFLGQRGYVLPKGGWAVFALKGSEICSVRLSEKGGTHNVKFIPAHGAATLVADKSSKAPLSGTLTTRFRVHPSAPELVVLQESVDIENQIEVPYPSKTRVMFGAKFRKHEVVWPAFHVLRIGKRNVIHAEAMTQVDVLIPKKSRGGRWRLVTATDQMANWSMPKERVDAICWMRGARPVRPTELGGRGWRIRTPLGVPLHCFAVGEKHAHYGWFDGKSKTVSLVDSRMTFEKIVIEPRKSEVGPAFVFAPGKLGLDSILRLVSDNITRDSRLIAKAPLDGVISIPQAEWVTAYAPSYGLVRAEVGQGDQSVLRFPKPGARFRLRFVSKKYKLRSGTLLLREGSRASPNIRFGRDHSKVSTHIENGGALLPVLPEGRYVLEWSINCILLGSGIKKTLSGENRIEIIADEVDPILEVDLDKMDFGG